MQPEYYLSTNENKSEQSAMYSSLIDEPGNNQSVTIETTVPLDMNSSMPTSHPRSYPKRKIVISKLISYAWKAGPNDLRSTIVDPLSIKIEKEAKAFKKHRWIILIWMFIYLFMNIYEYDDIGIDIASIWYICSPRLSALTFLTVACTVRVFLAVLMKSSTMYICNNVLFFLYVIYVYTIGRRVFAHYTPAELRKL